MFLSYPCTVIPCHCVQDVKLAIVRVILPTNTSFLATICPEAIPFNDVRKGVSHKRYMEIDSSFALELGIREQGVQVNSGANHVVRSFNSVVLIVDRYMWNLYGQWRYVLTLSLLQRILVIYQSW